MVDDRFPPEVTDQLGAYVYRLIDPRDGHTFYVGKGRGDRVFDHARAERDVDSADEGLSPKLDLIREIRAEGLAVGHVIHRHGLTDDLATEVEAALIDAYPALTNEQGGVGSTDRGIAQVETIIRKYQAVEADLGDRAVLLITVTDSVATRPSLYDAVRLAWRLNIERAQRADLIAGLRHGLIIGIWRAERWFEVSGENVPEWFFERQGRYGFEGQPAEDVWEEFVGRRVPEDLQGAQNPIRYVNC